MNTEFYRQLAKLVAMRTVSEDLQANDRALDYLQDYFAARGLHCVRNMADSQGTLIASTKPTNTLAPRVLLAAHVDVVPGSDAVFTLRQEGDKLLGRGVYDMKFAIAGYMQLVDDLQNDLQYYDFAIAITSDEEPGGQLGMKPLVAGGLHPGVCILPDSTAPNWDIETLAKGYWRFYLQASGRSAHASRPWDGESASFKLIDALTELKRHFTNPDITTDTINIGTLQGGETFNKIPDSAQAAVEIRFTTDERLEHYQELVTELCQTFGIVQKTNTIAPLIKTDLAHPLVDEYLNSVTKITGRAPKPFTSCASSDAFYLNQVDINCIVSCPTAGGHHSEDEWVSQKSLAHFVPILKDYLSKVARD